MTLYRPSGFIQMTLDEPYRMRGWTESWGCSGSEYRYAPQSGWSCDPSYPEVNGGVGTHGGCSTCRMTELQVIANYHTEVTFMSNPLGARIFIDGIEWWPGAVTAVDGATFRGVPPAIVPTPHTYEMRMVGYISATGTFELALDTPIPVTGNLVPLGIRATDIVPDVTTCTAPCDVNIDVTWINDAVTDMEFTPSLMIDGIPVSPAPYPSEILLAGTSVTHAFLVSGLTAAPHQICADPDSGTTCATIMVLTLANIVATTIVPSVDTCTAPCDLTVDITWLNIGQLAGTFTPTIVVDDVSTSLSTETLSSGQYVTHTFPLIDLIVGSHTICANPNVGADCTTITVNPAGGGAAMLFGLVGIVALGMMMTSKKHRYHETAKSTIQNIRA